VADALAQFELKKNKFTQNLKDIEIANPNLQKSFKNTAFYDKSGGEIGILRLETAEIVLYFRFFS
jgi:hypothetical protein